MGKMPRTGVLGRKRWSANVSNRPGGVKHRVAPDEERHHVVADSDVERDGVGSEPGEDVGADKFPVGYPAVHLAPPSTMRN